MTNPRDLVPGDEVTAVSVLNIEVRGTVAECSCDDPLCPALELHGFDGDPFALTHRDRSLADWIASVRIDRPAAGVSVL